MSIPRKTMGMEVMAVCELNINPRGECKCSDEYACKAIKGISTLTAIKVASTDFSKSASKARLLFMGLSNLYRAHPSMTKKTAMNSSTVRPARNINSLAIMFLTVFKALSASLNLDNTKAQLRVGTIKAKRNMKPASLAAFR